MPVSAKEGGGLAFIHQKRGKPYASKLQLWQMPDFIRPIFKSGGGEEVGSKAKKQKSQRMLITSFHLFDEVFDINEVLFLFFFKRKRQGGESQ